MKVYQYAKCSTCRKAIKFLEANEIEFQVIDITEQPPKKAELKKMLKAHGLKKLFNTSGQVYREMKLGTKLDDMSEREALELLEANGKLVKRPFVVDKSVTLVGFKQPEWEEQLLN